MKRSDLSLFTIIMTVLLVSCDETSSQVMIGNTEVNIETVAGGLNTPWEIIWGPDDHIWFTERAGTVSRLDPESGEVTVLLTIKDVYEEGESGLLGMALHPEFTETPFVYLAYTYFSGSIKERIVRYSYNGTGLSGPEILLDGITGGRIHIGARLLIHDDKLYVTTGEAGRDQLSQDLFSVNGKVLRMNLDGSIPGDNPIAGSYIWAWGLRNAQGLVMVNDRLYASDHGPNSDDEINLIEKCKNYGWPEVYGFCDSPSEIAYCKANNVVEPLLTLTPTLAVAGIDYYEGGIIPEWENSILMTSLKAGQLLSMKLSSDGRSLQEARVWLRNRFGRLRDICISPDGSVYLAVSNRDGRGSPSKEDDRIIRINKIRTSTSSGINSTKNGNMEPWNLQKHDFSLQYFNAGAI